VGVQKIASVTAMQQACAHLVLGYHRPRMKPNCNMITTVAVPGQVRSDQVSVKRDVVG
jgi:hypothetical protein